MIPPPQPTESDEESNCMGNTEIKNLLRLGFKELDKIGQENAVCIGSVSSTTLRGVNSFD